MAGGNRLDRHVDRYAARTRGMTASEIRALFAVASRPEIVSLAGGMPATSALPQDTIADLLAHIVEQEGASALQYGSGQGELGLRERIVDVMALESIPAHPDDVVVTIGSQQALDLIARLFLDPGDIVLAEAPSYVGALGVFQAAEAEVHHVPMDSDGLIPEALEDTLQRLATRGKHPKLLYTVPTFQNPAGVSLSQERRQRILEVASAHDLLIIEDNPYGLLGFDGEPLRALAADGGDNVIYLGTFSKTFAPGLRVGWAHAPRGVRERMVLATEASILCPSAFSQRVVTRYLSTCPWQEQIKVFRELYRERRDAMLDTLNTQMPPGVTWTTPAGGFYVWMTLPDGLDSKVMLPQAIGDRVAYVPGTAFYSDGSGASHIRLSYCYPTPERIRDGVSRLGGVIRTQVELLETFGPTSGRPEARRGPTADQT